MHHRRDAAMTSPTASRLSVRYLMASMTSRKLRPAALTCTVTSSSAGACLGSAVNLTHT
jgi:hypothetical protein